MAFVVSAGALASVERPVETALPASVQLADDVYASYAAIWRTQPQVRTVVGFLARNIAQLGLHVYERRGDTDRRRLTDHPLAQLLDRPLPPVFKQTRYKLINSVVSDLGIYDNAYLLKVRVDGRTPRGLVRLPPRNVRPIGENWFAAEAYELIGGRQRREFEADQVVHFFGYNPRDPRHGVSPMETLRQLLAEEFAANTFRTQMWRNGARTSGYLKRPAEAPQWSDPARRRFKADWRGQYTGDGPQAGGTPILEDGMDFVQAAFSPEQAQYLEARKLTRDEVAGAYYIPPPMVGILDHATFSNISEQHKMLYQDTLGPWLVMLEEDVELQLLPDLDTNPTVYVEFNISEKLKGSFEEQARSIQTLVGRPVLTADEGRALLNRNALGGDAEVLVTPLNVLIGGQASPTDAAPEPAAIAAAAPAHRIKARAPGTYKTKHEQVLRKFFRRQGAAVQTALGAKADDDWWDAERWDGELADDLYALALETSRQVAKAVLDQIGFEPDAYDVDRTLNFLRAVSERVAGSINAVTKARLDAALADEEPVSSVFEQAETVRAPVEAATAVTAISGFATQEVARQLSPAGRATKTWIVTSGSPRASHAAMNGQTVPVGEPFSNGAQWPGDGVALDVDETAGCSCDMEISIPQE